MRMNNIIEVHSLAKSFGSIHAVKGIDFSVEKGTLFAFLGINGAGKSTTIDMLCTLLKPDGGSAAIDGHILGAEDDRIRNSIGVVFQEGVLDNLLTVKENLELRGRFYGLYGKSLKEAVRKATAAAGAVEFLNRPYGKLSGGQRRRADIARALVHTPKILFLDEPTTGLDPQTRKNVWHTVRNLQREEQMTVFLTTHYMEEAAQADYITIMGQGGILAGGTPVELKQKYSSDVLKIKPRDKVYLARLLEEKGIAYADEGEVFTIELNSTLEAIDRVEPFRNLISNLEVMNGTMDDVFINVAGEGVKAAC